MFEPLNLPKGSIRSFVTLTMALSCWALVVTGRPVPAWLFSLILTVIGYYFGFRTSNKTPTAFHSATMWTSGLQHHRRQRDALGVQYSEFKKEVYTCRLLNGTWIMRY